MKKIMVVIENLGCRQKKITGQLPLNVFLKWRILVKLDDLSKRKMILKGQHSELKLKM